VGGSFDPQKRCLGRGKILWVVSASMFLLVARCLGHETEPHTIGWNGFRKGTHAAYGLGGAKATRVAKEGYGVDRFGRGSIGPFTFFYLLDLRGHSECSVGTQVAAPLGVPQLCSGEAVFNLLGSVGDIAILFGLVVGTVGRL